MKSDGGRMRIYMADIRPLYKEETLRRVYDRLDENRQKKADACRQPTAKAASVAVGFLAAYALSDWGCPDACVRYLDSGQPVVLSGGQKSVYLSLSHSGTYAVCAVASCPVGIDIQKEQPVRTGMLRHFFTEKERENFAERYGIRNTDLFLPSGAAAEFLRCWTAKESYMKLDGGGMSMGFSGILADLENGCVRKGADSVCLKEYPAPQGYYLSACLRCRQ